jgi:hypothetical protein
MKDKYYLPIDPLKIRNVLYDKKQNSVHKYDEYGNEVFMKRIDKDGKVYKTWMEWEKRDNTFYPIHYLNSFGHEEWYDYNEMGLISHVKKSTGYELWKHYNENGDIIKFETSQGKVIEYEYVNIDGTDYVLSKWNNGKVKKYHKAFFDKNKE